MEIQEITCINDIGNYCRSLSEEIGEYQFRGQAVYDWDLVPTIHRAYGFERYQTVMHEILLLNQNPQVKYPEINSSGTDLEWLMFCQHYEIPTRLLDWTNNELIALYFACNEKEYLNHDGAFFICKQNDYPKLNKLDYELMDGQTHAFVGLTPTNPRMTFQSGSFMMWGHAPLNISKSKSTYDLWEYHKINNNTTAFLQKIFIPKELKKDIVFELEQKYEIKEESVLQLKCEIHNKYKTPLQRVKEIARIMTLFTMDSSRLNDKQLEFANKIKGGLGQDCFSGCVSLSRIKLGKRRNG